MRLAWEADPMEEDDSPPPYYRCGERVIRDETMLFEFVIPLQDPMALDARRVEHYRERIQAGSRPTAVGIGVLDVKVTGVCPTDASGRDIEPEFPRHWGFANYLVDGHHKIAAAAAERAPITLLSFVAHEASYPLHRDLTSVYFGRPLQK